MILAKQEILREIESGRIRIEPLRKQNIGPASIDLTLDKQFRLFKKCSPVIIGERTDYKRVTTLISKSEITIGPSEFVLGITKEKITLPPDICGWLGGRSRFARLGLLIHSTAAFVQPGISNKQVLEIRNISPMPLVLRAGTRICQLILQRCAGKARYAGKFKKQESL